jgi:UDP-N-acetylmuramoyl-tripeptide--D-alanyl-D-alanine ligase
MRELGAASADAHRELGERAALAADRLFLIGGEAETVAAGARAAGMPASAIAITANRDELVQTVLAEVRPGDGLLVKASRAIALEAVVEAVLRRGRES